MSKKISIKGIIVGAVADVVGTNIWGIIAGIYLFQKHQLSNLAQTEQMNQLKLLLTHDPLTMVLSVIIGGGFSVLGGYIAARIARRDELLNGTLSSFLCVLFSLFAIGSSPITHVMIGVIVNPILGFIGGYFRLWQMGYLSTSKVKADA